MFPIDECLVDLQEKANQMHDAVCLGLKSHFNDILKEIYEVAKKLENETEDMQNRIDNL